MATYPAPLPPDAVSGRITSVPVHRGAFGGNSSLSAVAAVFWTAALIQHRVIILEFTLSPNRTIQDMPPLGSIGGSRPDFEVMKDGTPQTVPPPARAEKRPYFTCLPHFSPPQQISLLQQNAQ
jgi:hypothetical protein